MMSRAEMLAVIAIINRDLPGLLPKGLEDKASSNSCSRPTNTTC